jgi:hypothetical protein
MPSSSAQLVLLYAIFNKLTVCGCVIVRCAWGLIKKFLKYANIFFSSVYFGKEWIGVVYMIVINLLYKKYVDQATNESEVKIVFNTVFCA